MVKSEESDALDQPTEEQSFPLQVEAKLEYDERRMSRFNNPDTDSDEATSWASRIYEQAEATIRVDGSEQHPALPKDIGPLLVRVEPTGRTTFASTKGSLKHSEFDLIHVIGNSLLVDGLLPEKSIDIKESWNHNAEIATGLLALDDVSVCEMSSVVEKTHAKYAQMRLAGTVHGVVDGAATEIEIKGVYRFNKRLRRITHCNLAIKEKRSVGGATPGLDVVAKLRLKITPSRDSNGPLRAAASSIQSIDKETLDLLAYNTPQKGFRFSHDHAWHITSEEREAITLRRVNENNLVAHCTLRKLPSKSFDQATTLKEFQQDVRLGLGETFGEFVRTREWTCKNGNACLGVVARGKVEDVPVEWHYYLLSAESGERASLAFTMQGTDVKSVGNADRTLVESIELFEPTAEQTNAALSENEKSETAAPKVAARSKKSSRSRPPHSAMRASGKSRRR